ncbi:alpha/beta hydrolase [Wenyingzhuangia fucanilytica]|uniref:Alpha/beta hydrolase n=1 Tax=Wenyingzhuangia fucanilytica TaxID=1790137 RepID=A0A1B1Y9M9_9FLAO|nr:alpha/beta hydrolase [Wenyingzhuangia fucanilytica]ANW97438.1 alpha/beta hydrolase [Wenyingzhuangia fucanilytica]
MTKPNAFEPWSGLVPFEDTKLFVKDTGGSGIPILYLNGQFANQSYWKRVIAELGSGYRHITFDERARGKKSGKSSDYSFESCVRDVDAVRSARGVKKCIVVGWSYGAFVAAHWASRNPGSCLGAVLVDGAQPYDWLTEDIKERIRRLFKLLNPLMWLLRPTGLTPRLSATQMGEINIELGKIAREKELGPVLDRIIAPTRYVLASGVSFGSKGAEQEQIRTGVNPVVERNQNIKISAKVPSNHGAILKNDFRAVASAILEIINLIKS